MGQAMMDDGRHAGIADQDFRKIPGRGIADESGPQVADQKSAYGRQLRGEAARQLDRVLAVKARQQLVADEQRPAMDLLEQGIERDTQRVADKIVNVLAVKVELPVMPRKQRFGEAIENSFQRIT
jgi:hypothetical protein